MKGLRVVRGPDWTWRDQDGGEGHVGTVVAVEGGGHQSEASQGSKTQQTVAERCDSPVERDGSALSLKHAGTASLGVLTVIVQWDCGNRCRYRCGAGSKYDLRVLDSAPTGLKTPVLCNSCAVDGIAGLLWKCVRCFSYHLCTQCYMTGKHSQQHEFYRIDTSDARRSKMPARYGAKRLAFKGIFPGATVVRGHDWKWGVQDGGEDSTGIVTAIRGWDKDSSRSVAYVEWKGSCRKNIYRVGHIGKVDLKCLVPSIGGFYYPEHLPVLGLPWTPPAPQDIASGDTVKAEVDVDLFESLQEGHGGFNEHMAEVIGHLGQVVSLLDSGDVRVLYCGDTIFIINQQALTKVDVPQFSVGDVVRVLDDMSQVNYLQDGHGGWTDDMALALGQLGTVTRVFPTGQIQIKASGRSWVFNPFCLTHAPGDTPPELSTFMHEGQYIRARVVSLLEMGNPTVVPTAAFAGEVDILREYLKEHPSEVNVREHSKTPLHCAVYMAHLDCLKLLLEFKPNLEEPDEAGERPLHLSAGCCEAEAAVMLMNAGADVNAKTEKGVTALMIAAAKGHVDVLKVLSQCPTKELWHQDPLGKTALHYAVFTGRTNSVKILLDAGADPSLVNFDLSSPLHDAARIGLYSSVEQFVHHSPQHINLKAGNGFTALHYAALNNHGDIVALLANLNYTETDAKTDNGQTALHIGAYEGFPKVLEPLVECGADVNAVDQEGHTPLHLTLRRKNMNPIFMHGSVLQKIRDELVSYHNTGNIPAYVTVACYLVDKGADTRMKDQTGRSPLEHCTGDVATILQSFIERRKGRTGDRGSAEMAPDIQTSPSRKTSVKDVNQPVETHSSNHKERGSKRTEPVSLPDLHYTKNTSTLSSSSNEENSKNEGVLHTPEPCFLCESPSDVKFSPCGHSVMCSKCTGRAKKCPLCRVPVESVSQLSISSEEKPASEPVC